MVENIKPYPLYDKLLQMVEMQKDKSIDIKRLCISINNIASTQSPEDAYEHYKEIAALILHHELVSNNGILLSTVPYDGKVMVGGKGIIYSIMNLPPLLQRIIAQYIETPCP